MDDSPLILHVEACQRKESNMPASAVEKELDGYLKTQTELVLDKLVYDAILPLHLKYVRFCSSTDKHRVNLSGRTVKKFYHVYQTWDDGCQTDTISGDNEEVPASVNWCLPNSAFEGLWETMIVDDNLKERLLSYVQTTLLYSSKRVNAQIIHWNGILLFHGPPGTGKTTLCKGLAQKLSIRLSSKYSTCQLIEINSHSLFSKWFSESAKLVLKLFTTVRQWLESNDHFVCILIDEVESLTAARKARGTEPTDSIRVVNAVLTQIDQLQRYPNFLILATSNVTDTIDVAFADRADLKLYMSFPKHWAIYEILKGCVEELIDHGLVRGTKNDLFEADVFKRIKSELETESDGAVTELMKNSEELWKVVQNCWEMSGRSLRKMPFLASSKFVNREIPTIAEYLDVLYSVISTHQIESYNYLRKGKDPGYYLEALKDNKRRD